MKRFSIKKFLLISSAALAVTVVGVQAQTSGGNSNSGAPTANSQTLALLQAIANNTNGILQQVNNLQNVLQAIGLLATAWITPDTSDVTASTIVPNFSNMGQMLNTSLQSQLTLQSQVDTQLFNNIQASTIPYANDLTYSTILGQPYFAKDPRSTSSNSVDAALNYVYNAAGINIPHTPPAVNWGGSAGDQTAYYAYYTAVMSAETYDAYVLSREYADKNQLNTATTTLITQASDTTNWMAKVSSENIGWVLRQLLLYQSQSLILMSELVESTKQIASVSAITNTLIIAGNMQQEGLSLSNAQGLKPGT